MNDDEIWKVIYENKPIWNNKGCKECFKIRGLFSYMMCEKHTKLIEKATADLFRADERAKCMKAYDMDEMGLIIKHDTTTEIFEKLDKLLGDIAKYDKDYLIIKQKFLGKEANP